MGRSEKEKKRLVRIGIAGLACVVLFVFMAIRHDRGETASESLPMPQAPAAPATGPSHKPNQPLPARGTTAPPPHANFTGAFPAPVAGPRDASRTQAPPVVAAGFAGAPVLLEKETAGDPAGRYKRVKIVQTSFKYPFIRVEETFVRDPRSGRETIVQQDSMVADHRTVKLRPEMTRGDLETLCQKLGAIIRENAEQPM